MTWDRRQRREGYGNERQSKSGAAHELMMPI
jgi:hypothetical protein